MPPMLRFGSEGPEVARLVKLLTRQGCAPKPPVTRSEPAFGVAIENMVLYFQMTHLGPDGDWLDVDGIVGNGTWWALENATGGPQRSFFEVGIPKGLTDDRRRLLETAVREHGVRETGSRANRGKDVERFFPMSACSASGEGPPWCCFYVSWVTKETHGTYLLGERIGSCHVAWKRARKLGMWEPNDGRIPTPGDAFVILHKDPTLGWCTGHIGFVLQVAEDGRTINTVEGNCGNRVKIGKRSLSDARLRGFINFFGDHPPFVRGSLRGAKDLGQSGTR